MPDDVIGSAALQMIFGGLMMVLIGWALGESGHVTLTARTAASWLYLALVGSVIGFAAFSYALQHLPVAIDGDARRQRILARRQPFREAEPIVGRVLRQSRKCRRKPGRNLDSLLVLRPLN